MTTVAVASALAFTAGAAEAQLRPHPSAFAPDALIHQVQSPGDRFDRLNDRPGPIARTPRFARLAVGARVPPRAAVIISRHARYGLPAPRPGLRYAIYDDRVYLVDPDTLAVVAFMGVLAAAAN